MKVSFNPAWQSFELVSGTVSNRDGSVHVVAPSETNLMDAEWVGSAPRYPGGKVLAVSFPAVGIGSIVRSTCRTIQRDTPFFWYEHSFCGYDPSQAMSLEIDAPSNLGLRIDTCIGDSLQSVCVTNNGRVIHRWAAGPLPAYAREESMPPWYLLGPTVKISAGVWSTYTRRLDKAFESAMRHQSAARERARFLVKGLRDDDVRVKAIRDFVARTIRNAGPPFLDLPISCLTPADTTLADGYGNSADRAILLTAMLRAVGFDAKIILASGSFLLAPGMFESLYSMPQPQLFDCPLVSVNVEGGTIYLNDSDQYGVLGATSFDRHPFLGFNSETGRVAVADVYRDHNSEEITVILETNGCAMIAVTNWFYGANCGQFRGPFSEMQPDELNRNFQSLVTSVSQSAEAVGGLTSDLKGYPGCLAFTVRAERYAICEGKALTLLLPEAGCSVLKLSGDERANPLFVADPYRSEWECRVIMPHGVRDVPVLPASFSLPLPDGLGRVSLDVTRSALPDGRICLTFHRVIKVESAILSSSLYAALLEINRRLTHPSMSTVMAEMK